MWRAGEDDGALWRGVEGSGGLHGGSMGRVADNVLEAYFKPVARSRPTLPCAASPVSSPDIHFARFMLRSVLPQDCSSFPVNWAGVGC